VEKGFGSVITSSNVHDVVDIFVTNFYEGFGGLTFVFEGGTGQHQVTAYGISREVAIKFMSLMPTEKTRIYPSDCKNGSLTLDEYLEELKVREVINKMNGDEHEA
jgi:hypothetical protein